MILCRRETLAPTVLLFTFPPPEVELRDAPARVDVHADGPGSTGVTVRVLTEGQSLSWRLPIRQVFLELIDHVDGRTVSLNRDWITHITPGTSCERQTAAPSRR